MRTEKGLAKGRTDRKYNFTENSKVNTILFEISNNKKPYIKNFPTICLVLQDDSPRNGLKTLFRSTEIEDRVIEHIKPPNHIDPETLNFDI